MLLGVLWYYLGHRQGCDPARNSICNDFMLSGMVAGPQLCREFFIYGLHRLHGTYPAAMASSRVLNSTNLSGCFIVEQLE